MLAPRFGQCDSKNPYSQFLRWLAQLGVSEDGAIVAAPYADSLSLRFWAGRGAIKKVSIRILGVGPQGVKQGDAMELWACDAFDASPAARNQTTQWSAGGASKARWFSGDKRNTLSGEQCAARRALSAAGGAVGACASPANKEYLGKLPGLSALLGLEASELCAYVAVRGAAVAAAFEAAARQACLPQATGPAAAAGGRAGAQPAGAVAAASTTELSVLAVLYALVGPKLGVADNGFQNRDREAASEEAHACTQKWVLSLLIDDLGAPKAEADKLLHLLQAPPTSSDAEECEAAIRSMVRETAQAAQGAGGKFVVSWPFGLCATGLTHLLRYPPEEVCGRVTDSESVTTLSEGAASKSVLGTDGLPIPTSAWGVAFAVAVAEAVRGARAMPLARELEIPALRGSSVGAAAMPAAVASGPHTFNMLFLNDGGGVPSKCGTPPSPALAQRCTVAVQRALFSKAVAQAQRFIVVRGEDNRKLIFDHWFVNGNVVNGVTVHAVDVTAASAPLIADLIGKGLAESGDGLTAKRLLVRLAAPARMGEPAWSAAFFVVSLWHPSWAIGEVVRGDPVCQLPASQWWNARRLPEWLFLYALPRMLRGASVTAPLNGPCRGELVDCPPVLPLTGPPCTTVADASACVGDGGSRFVAQFKSWMSSRGGERGGTQVRL